MDKQQLTINLIKSQIAHCKEFDKTDINYDGLYQFSAFHSVSNIVGKALFEQGIADNCENSVEFYTEQLKAVMDYQKQQFELERIKENFEKEKIPYVALKGAVIKNFYPEPEMRTSCDIDILVKKEDFERAENVLKQNLGAEYMCRSYHDVSYMTDAGVHIELHHTLCEDSYPGSNVLKNAWSYTFGDEYEKHFTNEFFVYYHIAHMAKHLVDGGFGIRLVSDLYLINKNMDYDKSKLDDMLYEGRLAEFKSQAEKLALVWFDDDVHNEATKLLEQYIFESGIFGTLEHGVAVRETTGGKKSSLLKRLFIPMDTLSEQYPNLKNKPYLYMWYSIIRIANSGFLKTKEEIRLINSLDQTKKQNIGKMLDMLDLNKK